MARGPCLEFEVFAILDLFIFFVAAFGYGELFRLPTAITSRMAYSNKNRDLLNISRLISILLSLFLVVGFIIALIGLGKAPVDVATGCVSGEDARIFPDRRGIADSWGAIQLRRL